MGFAGQSLCALIALVFLVGSVPAVAQTAGCPGTVTSGLVVEILGGWGGTIEDPGRLGGMLLAGRLGYSVNSTAAFNLRFLSANQKGEEVSPGVQADLHVGTVGADVVLRVLPGSNITPTAILGYGYSTQIAEGLPVYSGHGVSSGIGVVCHFSESFALDGSVMVSRTWYEPRTGSAGVLPFTDTRIWGEIGIAFYPGLEF